MPADEIPRNRMDSTGSGCDANGSENVFGSSPSTSSVSSLRARTDSEGSDKLTRFILPSTDGSPPKVLTLDEISNVVSNIQGMTLAHEIALNPDFKLQPYIPPESSLEHRIKEVMHKAFWDILREEIKSNPPCYNHAIQLLSEIKDCFPQILSSNNKRSLDHINEVLDTTIIRQQAERGVLDFKAYATFIINIMAKSCAPARDEDVAKLSNVEDVIETFRGILEVMTLMKLDMANFLLDYARNDILVHSVEYEKEKFKEYLKYYKFGFPATEAWLKRNEVVDNNNINTEQTIFNAYMELLDWNSSFKFPEILSNDEGRIAKLRHRAIRICTTASVVAVCSALPIISQRPAYRIELSNEIAILLQSITSYSDLQDTIENVWVHVLQFLNKKFEEEEVKQTLESKMENDLKSQVLNVAKKDSPVHNLMWRRLIIYCQLVMSAKVGQQPPIPPGYNECKAELESCTMTFKRVISYNHSIFGDTFGKIITGQPYTEIEETNKPNLNEDKAITPEPPTELSN